MSRFPVLNRRTVLGAAALLASTRPALALPHLSYWHHFTSPSEFTGMRAVLELFARTGEASVEQDTIPNPDFMTKFTAAALSGSLPDVTMMTTERLDDMLALGGVLDISERVAAWPGRSVLPADRWTSATRDGRIYGVPAYAIIDWLYYRKDWFEEAGLAEPPATLEAFREAALRLTDPTRGRYGFGLRAGAGGGKYVIDVMEAFGSPPLRGPSIGLDRTAAVEAVRFWADLVTRDRVAPPSAAGDGYRQVMEAFRAGRTGMVLHHTGSLREITATLKPGVEVATAPVPAGPKAHVARVSYISHAVASPREADAAFSFARFWADDAAGLAFHEATGFVPASRRLAERQAIAGNPLYAAAVGTLGFGRPPPAFAGASGWTDMVVLPAFQSVLVGQSTVEEAVDAMERGLEAAVAAKH